MDYTTLGWSSLKVSRLGLGTMSFGDVIDATEAHILLNAAEAAGINFIDSSDIYGCRTEKGYAESCIGSWLKSRAGLREKMVIGTKVFYDMNRTGTNDANLREGLSARKIITCCEASLKRLQVETIDLYSLHHVDRNCSYEELWTAAERLTSQGKVLYFGTSNFAGWDLANACHEAKNFKILGPIAEQSVYNLCNRSVESEVLPCCRAHRVGLTPWSPTASGLLAGDSGIQPGGRRAGMMLNETKGGMVDVLKSYKDFCDEIGVAPAQVAIAWLLHQKGVCAPIVGSRTPAQLAEAVASLDVVFDNVRLNALDTIFPGPGEAPTAYAYSFPYKTRGNSNSKPRNK